MTYDCPNYRINGKPFSAEIKAYIKARHVEAKKIDPATAELMFTCGDAEDPYFVGLDGEAAGAMRICYARRPGSTIWVTFQDLPPGVEEAICKREDRVL